jgi:hypothetical protein
VIPSKVFLEKSLHNPYADLKAEVLESLKVFNPYSGEYDEESAHTENYDAALTAALLQGLGQLIEFRLLDLAIARSVIRHGRRSKIADLAPVLLEQLQFFSPVINDVALYLNEITDAATAKNLLPLVLDALASPALDNRLVRYWFEWYVCQHGVYLNHASVRNFVSAGPNVENQALAAITTGNVQWVREKKPDVLGMADWARRAIYNAARILPSDERDHWLKMCRANSPVLLDRLVATWVIETA